MASVGGSGLTERQLPAKTVATAVRMTLILGGICTNSGSIVKITRPMCIRGAGRYSSF